MVLKCKLKKEWRVGSGNPDIHIIEYSLLELKTPNVIKSGHRNNVYIESLIPTGRDSRVSDRQAFEGCHLVSF